MGEFTDATGRWRPEVVAIDSLSPKTLLGQSIIKDYGWDIILVNVQTPTGLFYLGSCQYIIHILYILYIRILSDKTKLLCKLCYWYSWKLYYSM